jgi:uncharacterized protein (DUF885 family)
MNSVVDAFFVDHVAARPEDASTLGIREQASRLTDPRPPARTSELAGARRHLRNSELALGDGARGDTLLDLDAVARSARFTVRYLERDRDAENLELLLLPNAALQHGLLHAQDDQDWTHLTERAEAVPAFVAAHTENLSRGARDGRAPDREIVALFSERLCPSIARAIRTLATAALARGANDSIVARLSLAAASAGAAYDAVAAFLGDKVALHARATIRLGEDEVAFRLRDVMGVERTPADLVAFARKELACAHEEILRWTGVKDLQDAREAVAATMAPKAATVEDALARYKRHLDAATRWVRERSLVPVPPGLALEFEPLPAGFADGGSITNWPAPLLDPKGRGHVLYAPEAAAHPLVPTKNLAVHEGIPGHYLQSAVWQRLREPHAVRFLGVADDVAFSCGYFGTMISVEGWAVHMEQLMREEGFYDPGPERLFFAVCDAIRAVRVLLDLELHAGDHDEGDLVHLVASATLLPEDWARAQVIRAKRLPLQGLTYLIGASEIAALCPQGASERFAFYESLLTLGPVPLSRSRGVLAEGPASGPSRA